MTVAQQLADLNHELEVAEERLVVAVRGDDPIRRRAAAILKAKANTIRIRLEKLIGEASETEILDALDIISGS